MWTGITIFILAYIAIASEKVDKTIAAMIGAGLMVAFHVADFTEMLGKVDLNVLGLLIGMMIIVNVMATTGVFEYLAVLIARQTRGNGVLVTVEFLLATAIISAFMDNVTTIILMAPITILITQLLGLPTVPVLILEALFSNIGGTATLVGDPPNILIGASCGLSFNDFLINLTPIIVVITLAILGIVVVFMGKRLRSNPEAVAQVQLTNLADMRIDEDVISEFRQLSRSFNQMLERLNNAFAAQRQFTGNAAHELRTPLALMQAQLELFSAEHPDVLPETAEFLALLREQTERLTQMTKTLLEMSNLQQVARNEQLQLAPMVEEIFTDLAPLAEKRSITLEAEGDAALTGSDALIYRLLFNLTENAVKYNRPGGSVRVELAQGQEKCIIRVSDTGCGIPEEYQRSIFHPFFRVDKSRSREYGGAGLGLSLVWEIANLHGGSVWVEESSDKGTTIAVELPAGAESDSLSADIP